MAELVPVEPFDIVVFGATGDLALRKLIPALFHRWCDGQITADSRIIAASREPMSDDAFRDIAARHIFERDPTDARRKAWSEFIERMSYVAVDVSAQGEDWADLKAALDPDEDKIRLYYLALPPSTYGRACAGLAAQSLNTPNARIVLEKPIGTDFHSARRINDQVGEVFRENNIFRIDHYLGKETVQNLLILRFANYLFEPIWNANGIDHVQITVAESLGAGERAGYYDRSGALRDMVQNHLLQLACLVAMEPPASLDPDAVRTEKLKVLKALRPITAANVSQDVVRGQYQSGAVGGSPVPGYADEIGADTGTETFVAIRAQLENWRWAGVPFYMRTGKRMGSRRSEIIVQFKPVPHDVVGAVDGALHPNRLVIRLQPDEGVKLMLMTKDPGPGGLRLRYVPLNLSYAEHFEANYPDAYERLLMAIVRGNLSLFMRRDEVEAAWRWVDGIIRAWDEGQAKLYGYQAGTDGPTQAALLLAREDREWFDAIRH
ncbi:glucose-6-phosphate dehydrogenase [Maricaulis sp.]|uniref:glucose-6-phosphate dehydrogenase n=1 Tax=Maricaulis sp. TaxID=1486257 RepID=UPI001B0140B9|nr:glucose-6-phosphate dehydrogenase [Maricaulis sp.]MBO6766345.1 glucose-6-phosphate dehydrogenase [Maricaulis sp.]